MLWWLAETAVMTAALAGVVALLCRLGRFRPAVRHALWLVVLAKLLTPPLVQWPWEVPDFGRSEQPEAIAWTQPPTREEIPLIGRVQSRDLSSFPPPSPVEVATVSLEPEIMSAAATPSTSQAMTLPWWHSPWVSSAAISVWLAGTTGVFLLQCFRILRFRRLVVLGRPAPRWLVRQVKERADQIGARRPQTLVIPGTGSPLVWAFGKTKLLWPASLLGCLPHPCCRTVIVHELAHLRRRDHWVGWLLMLAECVWWWNPVFWYVRRQLRLNAELACDAWVVGTLPGDRRVYAEALIEVTQLVSVTAAPAPVLGMNSSARQVFERRLTMIMRDHVPCRVPVLGLVVIGLLGLLALPGWSQAPAKRKEQPAKNEAKPAEKAFVDIEVTPIIHDLGVNFSVSVLQDLQDVKQPQSPTDAERDKRLQALEKQIQNLLKEVQALRSGKAAPTERWKQTQVQLAPQQLKRTRVQFLKQELDSDYAAKVQLAETLHQIGQPPRAGDQVLNLSRATYKLPPGKGEVLAAFLRDYVKAQVMETKVEGDKLTVTTTPDVQKAIGGLIDLIQVKTAAVDKQSLMVEPIDSHRLDRYRRVMQEVELLNAAFPEGKEPKKTEPKK